MPLRDSAYRIQLLSGRYSFGVMSCGYVSSFIQLQFVRRVAVDDDDIIEEADGTFTLSFDPWCDEPLRGIPTKHLAREIARIAYEAMKEYGRSYCED